MVWASAESAILDSYLEDPHIPEVNTSMNSTWPKIAGLGSKPTDYSKFSILVIPHEYIVRGCSVTLIARLQEGLCMGIIFYISCSSAGFQYLWYMILHLTQ